MKIAGHDTLMTRPSPDQLVGLMMWSSAQLPDDVKLKSLTNMFLSLLDDVAKAWFMDQLLAGNYTAEQMAATLMAVAGAATEEEAPAEPAPPVKRAPRKTAAKNPRARS